MKRTSDVLGIYRYPLVAISVIVGLVMFVPFLILVATSWTEGAFLMFPPTGFSFQWYASVLNDPRWMEPFWLSVFLTSVSTAVAVLFGTAGALAVSRLQAARARIVRTIFIIPIALPPIAYAVGLYGINLELGILRRTLVTFVVGEALLAMPYVFVLVSAAMSRMDPALRSAAATMGADWRLIIRKVELPAVLPVVVAGAIFAYNVVFDEVVLSVFLLPPGTRTLPLQMLSASQESFTPQLSAASTMISLVALVILAAFAKFSQTGFKRPKKGVTA